MATMKTHLITLLELRGHPPFELISSNANCALVNHRAYPGVRVGESSSEVDQLFS